MKNLICNSKPKFVSKQSLFFGFIVVVCFRQHCFSQCDDLINKSYDKFTQKTTITVKKNLELEKNGIQFSLAPETISPYGSSFNIIIRNFSSQKFPILLKGMITAVILFDDNTTEIISKSDIYEHSQSSTLEQWQQTSFTLLLDPRTVMLTTGSMDSDIKRDDNNLKWQNSFIQRLKYKKVTAIRFSGIDYSNIDIDLKGEEQNYFMTVCQCF